MATQWRVTNVGGGLEAASVYWLGLDYTAVAAGFAGHGISSEPRIWDGLRVMEATARNTLNGMVETN